MKRKLLIFLGIITIFAAVFGGGKVYAASCDKSFLGFNAWWNGLDAYMNDRCELMGDERIGDNLPSFVWTIVLNVLHDLLTAIGYISIALITFGGYMYITSSGDPGKSVKARKTLTSAVVGLILVLLANVLVDTAISILNPQGSTSCTVATGLLSGVKLPNCNEGYLDGADGHVIANIFSSALSAGAIMAVGFIVYGGISYITANGSPDKARKALRTLIFAAVGLAVVVAAAVITNFVMSSTDDAVQNAPDITTIITTWKG